MQIQELPIGKMVPRVFDVRPYEALQPQKLHTQTRTALHYELGFYVEGGGTVTLDGAEYRVRAGDIRFSAPGAQLCSVPTYRCITVYFDFGQENVLYKNQILDGLPGYVSTDGALQSMFEELVHNYRSGQVYAQLRLSAILMRLLAELFALAHSRKKYCKPVQICMEYMQQHFTEDVRLETLGALTGYSDLHLLRLFRRDTGQTPHKWLTVMRLGHAKQLLAETEMKMDEVAVACGFDSVSHFKMLFRKLTGTTPGGYRKNTRSI